MKLNPPPRAVLLAFLGGALGSVLRFSIGEVLDTPTTLLVVNLLGSAFLGWVNGSSGGPKPKFVTAEAKWFWGAGFAGGFTTMSGLALGFILLTAQIGAVMGIVYLLSQLFFGLICYGSGFRAGRGEWPSV